MIEFIFIIVGIAMIIMAYLNWSMIQAITKESESQRREREYLSEQRENKLNENRENNEKYDRKDQNLI